jgi:hypothetical protein
MIDSVCSMSRMSPSCYGLSKGGYSVWYKYQGMAGRFSSSTRDVSGVTITLMLTILHIRGDARVRLHTVSMNRCNAFTDAAVYICVGFIRSR